MNQKIISNLTDMAKSLIANSSDVKSYQEGTGPSTPWSKAQVAYKLDKGAIWYSTAGHGGLGLSKNAANKLSPHARALAMKWGGAFWFEEDIAWVIPFFEMPHWAEKYHQIAGGKQISKEELKKEIEKYYPDYFSEEFQKDAKNEAPPFKDLKVGDFITLDTKPATFEIIQLKPVFKGKANNIEFRLPISSVSARMKKIVRDGKVIYEKKEIKGSIKTASNGEKKQMDRSLIAREMLALARQILAGPQIQKLQDYGRYVLYSVEDQGKKIGFLEKWKDTSSTKNPWKAFSVNDKGQVGEMLGAFYDKDGGKAAAINLIIKTK